MNRDFFNTSEAKCIDLLMDFNEKTNVFNKKCAKTPDKLHKDASAITTTRLGEERVFAIELKNRNLILLDNNTVSGFSQDGHPYTADTVYIEDHKVGGLLLDYIYLGQTPLYINFLLDGSTMVFNLAKLSERPKQSKEKAIKSRGYGKFEMAKRVLLKVSDAVIYDKDGKLIYKPSRPQ